MSKQLMVTVWLVCLIVSLGLFWIGLGQPYLNARAFAEETIQLNETVLTARQKAATPNYWIGAAAPVAILLGSIVLFARQPRKD